MECFIVKRKYFSFGDEEERVLNNTVYSNFQDAVKAMAADLELAKKTEVYSTYKNVALDEKKGTAYLNAYKTSIDWTVETLSFEDGKRG